ncbi:alpha/beta-hydrolase [Choiromyces venosus 120613-1]|uniref:Alpha/beta-hydrolase n=1 Tax=Choiromyces venosus 120613-1 TaxID=1336337 RepID=A0A3N4JDG4_9PEZI|nr:alpha/beta-hydrolase [Choiromyces venosus 120613-1]
MSGLSLPTLTIPYATYKAYSYDVTDDYYTFKNIRFAAPPVGDLRWKKPAPPLTQIEVQDGTIGFQCNQAISSNLFEPVSEGCLFLDIMVPGKVVRDEVKDLPVLFWIFGGGYTLGSKSCLLYDGNPLLKSAGNNIIYVAQNYRLGAFGFLNGPTVENDSSALTNVVLWDQRAALQWVQDYIGLIDGDKNTVTAMGTSAGAGSIMHHLTAESGTVVPQFKRAIIMSPAFEPQYDPDRLQNQYAGFEAKAGCARQGISCFRNVSEAVFQKANMETVSASQYGSFVFGLAIDGTLSRDLPRMELAKGNYYKDVEILLGHTSNEGLLFADPTKIFNPQTDELLTRNFPNASAATRATLDQLCPEPSQLGQYKINLERLSGMIGEWLISCNPGIHGFDLILAFWRTGLNISQSLQVDFKLNFITDKNLATGFQSYLTSFARTGNPNTYRESGSFPSTRTFPQATISSSGSTALDIGLLGFNTIIDPNTPADRCAFWEGGSWTGRI